MICPPARNFTGRSTLGTNNEMNGNDNAVDHGQRITKLETAFENVAKSIDNLTKYQETRDSHIDKQFNTLYGKLDERTRPNIQTWIAGLALLGMVIFGVWTPFTNGLADKLVNLRQQDSLSDQVQNERISKNEQAINEVKAWQKDAIEADLAELRARRMGNEPEMNRK